MSVRLVPVRLDEVESALDRRLPADAVLDLVDDVIEEASGAGDRASLLRLEALLDAAAETRDDARGFGIAARRASTAAAALGAPVVPPPVSAVTSWAPAAEEMRAAVTDATVPAAPPDFRYAGWWSRALALMVDWFALSTVFFVVPDDASDAVWFVVLFAFPLAYFAGFHTYNKGRTIGKALFGIAVRLDEGGPIDLPRAVARGFVQGLLWVTVIGGIVDSLAPVGDSRNRALHDRAAGTVVVRQR